MMADRHSRSVHRSSALARAGFVLAREGVFSDVDPLLLPPAARAPLALAKLVARRDERRVSPASPPPSSALGPVLRQARTVSGDAARRRRPDVVRSISRVLQDRMAPFPRANAIAHHRSGLRPTIDRSSSASASRSPPPPSRRSIERASATDERRARGRRQGAAAGRRAPVPRAISATCISPPGSPSAGSPEARRLKPVEVVDTLARTVKWRWISGSRPRRRRNSRENCAR